MCRILASLLTVLFAASGCTQDPPATTWRITLAGATVGEERRGVTESGWWSERRYDMMLAGERVTMSRRSEVETEDGRVVSWSDGSATVALDRPLPVDLYGTPTMGEARVYDPSTQQVRAGSFTQQGRRVVFSDGQVEWWTTSGDDGLVAYGSGALRVDRQPRRMSRWTPVDPAVLMGLRGEGPLTHRGTTSATLRLTGGAAALVDGHDGVVVISHPAWVEVPDTPVQRVDADPTLDALLAGLDGGGQRTALAALVQRVPAMLSYAPTPVADPQAALHGAQGDCTEHVAIFVRASGALGLDARPTVGWVATASGDWVPHAWVEVHLANGLVVPMDPTSGARVADPLYLPLASSLQLAPWAALARAPGSRVTIDQLR